MFLVLQACSWTDFCTGALFTITGHQEINFEVKILSLSAARTAFSLEQLPCRHFFLRSNTLLFLYLTIITKSKSRAER